MGGILFSSFEALEDDLYQWWSGDTNSSHSSHSVGEDIRILFPSLLALAAGGTSGSLHGLAYTSWDALGARLFPLKVLPTTIEMEIKPVNVVSFRNILAGTMLSHTFVHGVLFGSYEVVKRSALMLVGLHAERDTSRVEGKDALGTSS